MLFLGLSLPSTTIIGLGNYWVISFWGTAKFGSGRKTEEKMKKAKRHTNWDEVACRGAEFGTSSSCHCCCTQRSWARCSKSIVGRLAFDLCGKVDILIGSVPDVGSKSKREIMKQLVFEFVS